MSYIKFLSLSSQILFTNFPWLFDKYAVTCWYFWHISTQYTNNGRRSEQTNLSLNNNFALIHCPG